MEFGQADTLARGNGTVRTRVFDVIRKKGTLPSRGNHHRRAFDIVARVEARFSGTRQILDSLFWELLTLSPRDIDETTRFVERCLDRLELKRLSAEDGLAWLSVLPNDPNEGSLRSFGSTSYERTLRRATKELQDDLDLAALFGGLYREACLDFCLDNAEVAGIFFKLTLEEYLGATWTGPTGQILLDVAINRVLHGRTDYVPSESEPSIQSVFGTVSQRFVVCERDSAFPDYLEQIGSPRDDSEIATAKDQGDEDAS